ncbi:hypothetical protein CYMTET_54287 [Cymbomonas tetramitiformis]|uniref:Uncharacterized protein n=1 Tax=Cymbomonas tetramitiformis TaxID=36881 RepID=A0AAE0EQW5_9CHLO|nr:hypothetical protein CYMTET_54287 [Cymbomonas tetramitiformis]
MVSLPGGKTYANTQHSLIPVDDLTGECAPLNMSNGDWNMARVLYVEDGVVYYTAVSNVESGDGSTALHALNLTDGDWRILLERQGMLTNETLAVGVMSTKNGGNATGEATLVVGFDNHAVTIFHVDTGNITQLEYRADRFVDAIVAFVRNREEISVVVMAFHEPDLFEVVEMYHNATDDSYDERLLLTFFTNPRNVSEMTPFKLASHDFDLDGHMDLVISSANLTTVTTVLPILEFQNYDQSKTYFDVYHNRNGHFDLADSTRVYSPSLIDLFVPSFGAGGGIRLINHEDAQMASISRMTYPPLPSAPPLSQQMPMCMDRPAHMIHGETLVGLTEMYGGLCYELSPAECNERAPCHLNVATARCDFSLEHFLRRRERVHSTCTGIPFDFCSQADICVPGMLDTDSQNPSCEDGAVNITSQACSIYAKAYHNESVFKGISDERVPDKTTLDDEDPETECPSLFDEDSDEPSPRVVYESSTRRCFVGFQGNGADANSDSDAPCCDRATAALRSFERIQGNIAINNVALFGTALSEEQLRLLYNYGSGVELDSHMRRLLIMWLPLQHLHHRDYANPPSFVTEWRAYNQVDGMMTDLSQSASFQISGTYYYEQYFFYPNQHPNGVWHHMKPAGDYGESDRFVKVNNTAEPYRLIAGPTFENVRMINRTIDHDEYAMLRSEGDSDSADGELSYTGPGAEWLTNFFRTTFLRKEPISFCPLQVPILRITKAPVYPESFGASIASHLVDSPEELPFAFDSDTLRLQEPLGGDLIDRLKFAHRYVPAVSEDRAHATTFTLERPTLVYLGVPKSVADAQDVNASLYNQLASWGGWSRASSSLECHERLIPTSEAPSSVSSVAAQRYERTVAKDSSGTLAARARARQYGGYDKQEPVEWYSAVADRGTHTLRCGDDDPLRDGGSHPAPHCSQTVIAFSARDDAEAPRVLTPFKGALVGAAALRNSTPYTGTRPMGGDPTLNEPHERDIGRTAMWVYYDPIYYEGDSYYWRTGDAFIDEERPGPSRPHLRESMKKRDLHNPHEHPGALLDGIVSPAFESTTMKPDYQKPHLNERDSVGERVRLDALPDTTGDNRIGIGGYFGFETTVDQRDMTVVLDFDGQLLGASSHAGRRFGLASVEIFNKHHPGQSSSGNRDFVSRVEIHCAASLILTEAGNPSVHDDPNWIPVVHPHVPGSGGKDLLRPVQRTQHINYVSYTLHNNEPTQIDLSKQCDLGAGMRYLRLRFDRVFSSARSHGGLAEIRVWGRELRPRDADRAPRTEASSVAVSPPAATAWRLDCAASGDQWNHNNNPTLASLNEWAVYDETGVAPTSKAFTSRAMPDAHFYSGTWARLGITATVAIPAPMYLEETYADSSTIYWATDGRYNINSGLSVTMTCPGSSIVHTFKSPVTPSSVVWVHNTYAMTGMRVYYASGNLSEPVRVLGDSVIPKRYPPIGFKEEAVSAGYLTTSGYDLGENLGVRSWTLSGVCEQGERRELHRRDGAVENEWYTWRGTEYIVASEFACNEFILTFRDLTTSNMISLTEWALFGSDTVADRDSLRPTWTEHAFYDLGDRPYLPNAPLSVPLNEARPATGARHWTLVIKDTIDRAGPLELMEASFLDDHLRLLQPESTFFSNNLSQSDPSVLHDGSENQNRMYRSDMSVNDAPAVYDRAVFPVLLNYTFPADQRPPRYVQFAYDSSEASAPREIEVQFSHGGHYWTSHGTYRTEEFDLHPVGTHRPVRYDLRRRDVGRAARYAHCELPRELAVTMDDESLRLSQQPLLSYLGSMEADAYSAGKEDDEQSFGATTLTRCALNDAQANHAVHLLAECDQVLDLLDPTDSFESSASLSLEDSVGTTAIIYNFSEPTSVGRIELTLADHDPVKSVQLMYHAVLDEELGHTSYLPFELAVERAGRDRLLLGPEDADLKRTVVYVSGEGSVSTTALRLEFGGASDDATTVALEGFRVYGPSPQTPDRSPANYTRSADERPLVVVAGGHAIFEVTNPERFVSTVVVEFLEDFEVPARWYLESRKLNGSAWIRSHTQIDDARARTAIRIDRDVEQFRLVIDDTHVAARYSLAAFEVYACECGNETNATLPELAVEAPRWILPSHEAPTGDLKAALDGSGELQESSSSSNAFIVYNERPIFANEETDLVGMQLHVHGRTGTVALLIVPDGVREDHRASSSEAHAVPTPSVGVHVSDTAVRGVRYWRAFDDESGAWSDTPESEEFDLLDPPSSAVAGGVLRLVVDATNGDVRAYRNTLANEEETADFYLAHHFDDRLAPIEHVHQYRVVMMNLEGAGFDLVDADTRDLYREHSCDPSERLGSRFRITPEFDSFECDAFRRLDFSSSRFQCVHFEHTLTRYGGWTRDEATERCVELGGTLLTIPDLDLVDAATFAAELRQAFHDSFRESVLADREHPLYQNIAVEELTATDLSELRFAMANLSSLTERTEAPPVFADVVARVDVASGEWRWELSSADTAAVDAESLWLGGLTPDPMQKPRCAVLREAASNATFDGEPRFGLEATDCESVLTHVACSRAANVHAPPAPPAQRAPPSAVDRFGGARMATDPLLRVVSYQDATLLSDEGETIAELAPYRPITLPSNVTYAYASVPITVYTNGPAEPAPVLLHARGVVLGCVTWIDANETLALRVMAHRAETRFAVVVEGDVVPTSWRADLALPTNVLVEANFTADRQVRAVFVRASDEISVSAQRAGDNEGGVSCMPLGDKLGGWTGVERSLIDGDANLVLSAFRPGRELNETSELFPFELVRLDELYQSTGKADSRRVYVGEAPSILAGSELNERMQVGQGAGRARFEFNDNATRGTYLLVGCVNNRTDGTFDVAPWIPERLFSTQFVYAYDTRPSIVGALSFHTGVLPDYVDATQQSVRQATTSAPEDIIAGLYLKSYVLESDAQLPSNETLITGVPAAHAVVDGRRLRTVIGSVDYLSGRLWTSSLPDLRP